MQEKRSALESQPPHTAHSTSHSSDDSSGVGPEMPALPPPPQPHARAPTGAAAEAAAAADAAEEVALLAEEAAVEATATEQATAATAAVAEVAAARVGLQETVAAASDEQQVRQSCGCEISSWQEWRRARQAPEPFVAESADAQQVADKHLHLVGCWEISTRCPQIHISTLLKSWRQPAPIACRLHSARAPAA